MKIRDITESSEKNRNPKNNDTLRDSLSIMLNTIEKFEKSRSGIIKNDRDKIEVIKNLLTDMIEDEDQRRVIKGEQ